MTTSLGLWGRAYGNVPDGLSPYFLLQTSSRKCFDLAGGVCHAIVLLALSLARKGSVDTCKSLLPQLSMIAPLESGHAA